MSEALKMNTTLTKLNIGGIDSRLMARFHRSLPLSQKCSTGNMLTKVGAASLLEALKTNTTLTSLNLNGEQTNYFFLKERSHHQLFIHVNQTENRMEGEGTALLSEFLKTNSSLLALHLRCKDHEMIPLSIDFF